MSLRTMALKNARRRARRYPAMRPWSVASKMRSRRMAKFFAAFADNMIARDVGDSHYTRRPLLAWLRDNSDDGGVEIPVTAAAREGRR